MVAWISDHSLPNIPDTIQGYVNKTFAKKFNVFA